MSNIFEVVAECVSELRSVEHSGSKSELLAHHVVKRLEQFSLSADQETVLAMQSIKKKILTNNQLSGAKKAKAIDDFSKIATGISSTYLGFVSRIIADCFAPERNK